MKRVKMLLAIALLGTSAPSFAKQQNEERGGTPIPSTSPGEWIAPEDYPLEARMNGRVGVTSFRLMVNTFGEPTECTVTESSGFEDLDARTCELVMMRARFKPPVNAAGDRIESTYANRIRWVLPSGDQFRPGQLPKFVAEAVVGRDGLIASCEVIQRNEIFNRMGNPCEGKVGSRVYDPNVRDIQRRLKLRIIQTLEIEVLDDTAIEVER